LRHRTHSPPAPPAAARATAEATMFQCVEKLMASTGFKPREIDFLIVNCR
jgi:3-oxoacyl-[acyl-carrier-protein] synthase III